MIWTHQQYPWLSEDAQLPGLLRKESPTTSGLGEDPKAQSSFLARDALSSYSCSAPSAIDPGQEGCPVYGTAQCQVAAVCAAVPVLNHPAWRASPWIPITILQARHKIIGLVRGEYLGNVFNKN